MFFQLRKFIKNSKVPSYTRPIKELLAKVTESSSVIVERRRTATLNLRDVSAVVRLIFVIHFYSKPCEILHFLL